MIDSPPQTVYLKNYKPPAYFIKQAELCFTLGAEETIVESTLFIEKNPQSTESVPLTLFGEEMELLSVCLDGQEVQDYTVDDKTLCISIPDTCTVSIKNRIHPKANTALDGLYSSGDILCTQCEPHGFRRITYFVDRPDNMAQYRIKLIGDQKKYPVMLSNGNCIEKGELDQGLHYTIWEDPFPKPSYLFAIVAGDLGSITDTFITASERKVDLVVYCDKGNEKRCQHAMDSLKKSMLWDEQTFGLEYDLDLFMIVVVDAFNFGAMENKGLNIFNSSAALADPKTETDANFDRVECVVAHEYFHNWTGNRVTCRDWFQLTLKEGLTVFRDQEFSSDMNCRAVERIKNVAVVRNSQFNEDAGPTAHPIKPSQYIQINNFYTSTVYRKGSEVIRMIETIIGKQAFKKGISTYFSLYDGQAVTTEDFIFAMEKASGFPLKEQFTLWYHQAGTPEVTLSWSWDEKEHTFTLNVEQQTAPTADQSPKEPFLFPFTTGLVGPDGTDIKAKLAKGKAFYQENESFVLQITEPCQQFVFSNVKEKPTLSANRNFTSPVIVNAPYSFEERVFLMAHDPDPFNRWDAGRELGIELLLQGKPELDPAFSKAFATLLHDQNMMPALKALSVCLAPESTLSQRQNPITFERNRNTRKEWIKQLAKEHKETLLQLYHDNQTPGPYRFEADLVGKRMLANSCLSYLSALQTQDVIDLLYNQYRNANHMTDAATALNLLCAIDCPEQKACLDDFYNQWKNDPLVMCKWFAFQAGSTLPGALQRVKQLSQDPVYTDTIPNIIRALWCSFAANEPEFHHIDGSGYTAVADKIISLDAKNPMLAAMLAKMFEKFQYLDSKRKNLAEQALKRVVETPNISSNTYEIASKTLI